MSDENQTDETTEEQNTKNIGEDIIEGLENAVAYAEGDKTKGKETLIDTSEVGGEVLEGEPDKYLEDEVETPEETKEEGIVPEEDPKPKKKLSSREPDYTKEDPLEKKLGTWQGADHLRKLLVTTGSTIGHYHREGILFQGKYRIEGQPSENRKHCLDYRAIDTTVSV